MGHDAGTGGRKGHPGAVGCLLLVLFLLVVGAPWASGMAPLRASASPSPRLDRARDLGNATNLSLTSVTIAPSSAVLPIGGKGTFAAQTACSTGPCPPGVNLTWSLSNDVGSLNYTRSNSVIASFPSGGEVPVGIAYDSTNGDVYVANDDAFNEGADSNVSVVSTATNRVIKLIPVGGSPTAIAFDPDNGYLYVTDCASDNISVINGANNSVVGAIPMTLSGCAIGPKLYLNYAPIEFDPSNRYLYVSNYQIDTVTVLNTSTDAVVTTIQLPSWPYYIQYDPMNEDLYVSDFYEAEVSVIDGATNTVITDVRTGSFPSGEAYDAANGDIYVADAGTYVHNPAGFGNVTVINGSSNTRVATIFVAGYPWFVTYDSENGCIYETDSNITVMKVISGLTNTIVGEIPIVITRSGSSDDVQTVFDPANGDLYVAGFNYNDIDVIGGGSDVNTFTAGPVPGSAELVVNATYNGTTVESPPVPIEVVAAPVYTATFNESGLPPGTPWLVNVTGFPSIESTTAQATLDLSNGTYYLSYTTTDKLYAPTSLQVSFTVEGGRTYVPLTFAQVTYPVTFSETGLPAGTNWSVDLNGSVRISNLSTDNFTASNGTYGFTVGPVPGYLGIPDSGNLKVDGNPVARAIHFTPLPPGESLVEFEEHGLPLGTSWGVALDGNTENSSTSTISFTEVNATYSYWVDPVVGYQADPPSGNLTVRGTEVQVAIGFLATSPPTPPRYAVNFREVGLPVATPLSVTFAGNTNRSFSGTVGFYVPNGTYPFEVGNPPTYIGTPTSGNASVHGKPVLITIQFELRLPRIYNISFTEEGLPKGLSWEVTFAGSASSAAVPTILFSDPNGTYWFQIDPVPGYTPTPAAGNTTVGGTNLSVAISFEATFDYVGAASWWGALGYSTLGVVAPGVAGLVALGLFLGANARPESSAPLGRKGSDPGSPPRAEPPTPPPQEPPPQA